MAKVQRKWIDLDPLTGLRAQDIPYSDTLSTADAINNAGKQFRNFNTSTDDFMHSADTDNDTMYFVGDNGIEIFGEIVDGKKIVRFSYKGATSKKCWLIDDTNKDQETWTVVDSSQSGSLITVYINGLEQVEDIHYTKIGNDTIIIASGTLLSGDILCIEYPIFETIQTSTCGVGAWEIGSTFEVGGSCAVPGVGSMIIGDTFKII